MKVTKSLVSGYRILYKAINLLTQVKDYYESSITEFKAKQLFLEISLLKLYSGMIVDLTLLHRENTNQPDNIY